MTPAKKEPGEKYATRKAEGLKLGDTVLVPLVVTELHLSKGRVDVTYADGSQSSHDAGEVVALADPERLPENLAAAPTPAQR